jgi:hypothetical protein
MAGIEQLSTAVMRLSRAATSLQIALWVFGGTSVFLRGLVHRLSDKQTLRLFGHKLAHCYTAVAVLTLNALLFYAAFELVAGTGFKLKDSLTRSWRATRDEPLVGEGKPRENVSYYSSQPWAARYWYEHRLSGKQQYYSYVGWRRAPFKGQTIEIDERGVRVTPGADCTAHAFKVFTFGESTMWGTGSPGWGTIPAYLQKGLDTLKPKPVCVVNFAETGYVSTQDTIMLLLQLRSGNIPDAVIFYSIGGDISAAYQSGRAGLHANLDDIAARFDRRTVPPTFVDLVRSTSSYALIDALMRKLTTVGPQPNEPPSISTRSSLAMKPELAHLAEDIAQGYLGTYHIVNALARTYGFKYFFFLQPSIGLGDKPLTLEEQQMKHDVQTDPDLYALFTSVYRTVERESSTYPNLHSMVHVFDGHPSLLWIDAGHVTPIGNELVAKRILEIIQRTTP